MGTPPAPTPANTGGENEVDPEVLIQEIFDKIVSLEAKVDRILEGTKSQKGGRMTRKRK